MDVVVPDEYDLHDFSITDQGVISFDGELMFESQALHGLAPKCKLINMHELINKATNDNVTLLPCENGANVNNKGEICKKC